MTDELIEIRDLRKALRALRKLPKDLKDELKDASGDIAQDVARRSASATSTAQEALVGSSIRARRGDVPKIAVGGASRVGSRGTPVGRFLFGVMFGGQGRQSTRQFRPHLGRRGYLIFPVIRDQERKITNEWLDAVERVIDTAARKGSV